MPENETGVVVRGEQEVHESAAEAGGWLWGILEMDLFLGAEPPPAGGTEEPRRDREPMGWD